MSIDAMKRALEALELPTEAGIDRQVIDDLRAAIEAAEKQEPVACLKRDCIEFRKGMNDELFKQSLTDRGLDVFTTPQPAIPDGWVLVPVEMPDETNIALGDKYGYPPYGWKATYKRILSMLTAAPKPGEKE